MTADDWPSHQAELSRKTATALEDAMQRHQAGRINIKELYLIVGALYDTTAGLIDKEVMDAIAAVHEEIRRIAARAKRARS